MNDLNEWLGGVLLGAIIGSVLMFFLVSADCRNEAIENCVAYYVCDNTGDCKFTWRKM